MQIAVGEKELPLVQPSAATLVGCFIPYVRTGEGLDSVSVPVCRLSL